MAGGYSSALADILLGTINDYTWIKLHVGDPGAAASSNAATETDRIQATWGSAGAGPVSNSRGISNTGALVWTAVAGTEDYTHFSAWDASTAGNFGFSGTITANAVVSGDTFTIPIGDLDVYLPIAA